ncbi:MAG TPA: dihydrofolate reductase family protein [Anaeromyxobacter sp.]|nr:dihydrofolate reductase family protein [Anaeromyxobacter sp.]
MPLPTFSVFVATSLDGFIARADGGLDWLEAVECPGEDYGYAAFLAGMDTLLLGRNTYEEVLRLPEWPYPGKRIAVYTTRGGEPRHGAVFLAGPPLAVALRLEADGARRVYLDGGRTISAFWAADLVDELTISVLPVVLGEGIRLFHAPLPERPLVLEETKGYPRGLVRLRYRRPGR